MKLIEKLFILTMLILTIAGCGTNENGRDPGIKSNSVEKVIGEEMEKAGAENKDTDSEGGEVPEESGSSAISQERDGSPDDNVDYDLTVMSSDMVYATVYQMMMDPDTYIGKTFRMRGLYYASYYEPTEQRYHYCIIQDAAACCAQGIEFVWGDGDHVYPDEYPMENTMVVVQGIFETYREDGDSNLYCRLRDAALEAA